MKGIIEKIEKKQTKNNKDYHLLTMDGERYLVWDAKLIKGLSEGNHVEFEWDKSGDFRKITSLKCAGGNNSSPDSPKKKWDDNPKSMYFAYAKDLVVALIQNRMVLSSPDVLQKGDREEMLKEIKETTIDMALAFYEASEGNTPDSPNNKPLENDKPPAESDNLVSYNYLLTNTAWQKRAEIDDWWEQRQKAMIKWSEGDRKEIIKVYHDVREKIKE